MTRVRLELYASQLKNVAGVFKGTSDPFAVVTLLASDPTAKPLVLGKTEVIKNSLSPHWTTAFELDYDIGTLTRVNIGIYDEIKKSANKPMGSAMFELGEILGAPGNIKAKRLRDGGTLFCRVTPARAQQHGGLTTGTLHLELQGVHLKNLDGIFGLSDPFYEVYAQIQSGAGSTWFPVHRSKHVENNLNPVWEAATIDLDRLCQGNLSQSILIKVWDWQENGRHQSMGSVETSVQALMQKPQAMFMLKSKGKDFGNIVVKAARIVGSSTAATEHSQAAVTVTHPPVTPAPPVMIPDSSIPNFSQALDVPPPSFSATSNAATAAVAFSSSVPGRSNYSSSATAPPKTAAYDPDYLPSPIPPPMMVQPVVTALSPPMAPPAATAPPATAMARPTFVDYLSGGCELELCIAIDFTGSNGDPRIPGTLHYIHRDGQLNDYEKAITAVGSVVARYSSEQRFPCYGFGAKFHGVIQHCFQMGGAPYLNGLLGVLQAYRNVFRTGLTMSGPTVFDEVIDMVAAMARSQSGDFARRIGKQSYKILLILTDGAVTDVERTKRSLQNASDAPLSIVIVGIGSADFSNMQFLDDVHAHGGGSGRDICQFVEFSKYRNDKAALTRVTLAEIPNQLVDYFHGRGIKPLPPISGSQISLAVSDADEEDADLSLHFNDEGEISLANYNGALYDDTKYDTITAYVPSAPVNPAATSATPYQPYVPNQPNVSSATATHHTHVYQPSAATAPSAPPASYLQQPYTPYGALQQQTNAQYGYYSSQQQAAPPVVAKPVFHVQVPPSVYPGMQVQVRNPVTGQHMIVVVPQGVAPGGKFAVQY